MDRIRSEFGIPYDELKTAWDGGKKSWGYFIRTRIYGESS